MTPSRANKAVRQNRLTLICVITKLPIATRVTKNKPHRSYPLRIYPKKRLKYAQYNLIYNPSRNETLLFQIGPSTLLIAQQYQDNLSKRGRHQLLII